VVPKSLSKVFHAVVICLAYDDENSLKNLESWINYAKSICPNIDTFPKFVPIIIALNKYDKSNRKFKVKDLEDYLNNIFNRENFYICSKISAKEAYGINLIFEKILEIILPRSSTRNSFINNNQIQDNLNFNFQNKNISNFNNKGISNPTFNSKLPADGLAIEEAKDLIKDSYRNSEIEKITQCSFRKSSACSDNNTSYRYINSFNEEAKNEINCAHYFNKENVIAFKITDSSIHVQDYINDLKEHRASVSNANTTNVNNTTYFNSNYMYVNRSVIENNSIRRLSAYSKNSEILLEKSKEKNEKNNIDISWIDKENFLKNINKNNPKNDRRNIKNQKLIVESKNKNKKREAKRNNLASKDTKIYKHKKAPNVKFNTTFEKYRYIKNNNSQDKVNKSFSVSYYQENESVRGRICRSNCCT